MLEFPPAPASRRGTPLIQPAQIQPELVAIASAIAPVAALSSGSAE